jgi:pyruvate/2-oxoacid:ferredoxin oxidoreductase beta subunit
MFIYSKECLSDLLQSINECVVTDILFPHSNKTIWGTPCQRIHNDNPIPHFIANITAHNLTSADISYKAIANSLFLLSQNFPPSSGATVLVTANPSTYATLKTLADLLSPGQSAMLCSGNAQEAYDMIIIAQMTLLKTKSLFLHFYDSRRIVEEYTNIDPLETGILSKLVPPELVTAYKNDGITDLLPNIYTTLSEAMDQFNVDTGRSYRLMEYSGHPEANIILVAMGTVSHLVEQTMEALSNQDKDLKVGMIRVRLHRPWSEKHFLELLPNSIQSIAVLEPVEDASVSWSPLFLDVVAACYQSGCEEVELHCGSYIADQDCVCPDNVVALISGLSSNQIPRQFSMDALKSQKEKVAVVPDSVDQCIFIGNENLALCYAKGLEKAQCYTVKKGHVPVTHIRSNATTDFPFLIEKTNIIVVPDVKWNQSSDVNYSIMEAIDILTEGGTFVTGVIDIETSLPNTIKQVLYSKKVQMVLIPDINSLFKEKQSLHDIIKQFTPVSVPESWKELQDKREHPFPSPARSIGLPLETPYLNVLNQVFGSRLEIANAMNSSSIWSPAIGHANAATPEFGYGYLVSKLQERSRFVDWVMDIIRDGELPNDAVRILSQWLLLVNNPRSNITKVNEASELVCVAFEALVNTPYNKIARPLLEQKEHLESKSNWLVGSDNWAEDLGLSGIHHVITSGDNINILIIDTTLYSKPVDREKRKKDIGLYAMNYGSVYVASVAIYSSYIGVLQALMEADAYPGPSIVLAYLPQLDNPVDMLKDTKVCVDNGSWPLYRWNPELGNMFKLDSQRIKHDLESFLNRENQLSLLTREDLDLSETLVSSIEAVSDCNYSCIYGKKKERNREAYYFSYFQRTLKFVAKT